MKFRNSAQCSDSPPSMDTKSEVSTEIVKPSTVSTTEKDPDVENSKVEEESQEKELTYLHGWRLYISTVAFVSTPKRHDHFANFIIYCEHIDYGLSFILLIWKLLS